MGESLVAAEAACAQPIMSVAAECVDEYPEGPLIIRVRSPQDVSVLNGVHPDRIIWMEAPSAIAFEKWPSGVGLDAMVSDPAKEAANLYSLTRVRDYRPLRVTIPGVAGVGRAARIAMALQIPIRLLLQQPTPEVVSELYSVLKTYLHDPQTNASVQPFDSALAFWLHGNPATVWMALDLDPAYVRQVPDIAETQQVTAIADDPDFVGGTLDRLIANGAECADCPFVGWCAGFFKWPNPNYTCEAIKPLLGSIADSAAQIARDLEEAEAMES